MSGDCERCKPPSLDLEKRPILRMARLVFDELASLGGTVQRQQELVRHLWRTHRVGHGTTQRYVDALAARGFLRVEYYWDPVKCKRVIAVERP